MNIFMNKGLADGYRSASQRIRLITEGWVAENLYCIRCGNPRLEHFPNNQPVADFYCPHCHSEFELKSHKENFGRIIADGSYETMLKRLHSNENPDLLALEYQKTNYRVNNLWAVPKYFFTPDIIEKRKPLSERAQRAGWTGCNIVWSDIPNAGRIALVREGHIVDARTIRKQIVNAERLNKSNMGLRGWLMDVLRCVDKLNQEEFTLADMYSFTTVLQEKYAANHNIQAKIRQQLQFLRDQGYIQFLGNGRYRKIPM